MKTAADLLHDVIVQTLEDLHGMTTEEFATGGDRAIRDRLALALGYHDYDDWCESS